MPRLRLQHSRCMLIVTATIVVALLYSLALPGLAISDPSETNMDSTPAQGNSSDLTGLSLEDLMNIEVTSASKKAEKLFGTASAIYVITQEDIRRSGATSIPEALRMVPGMQVAHIDDNKWVVASRGFGDRFANKLLVLMDGRSVYTPLFSGTIWDVQDTLLNDIDRIEVIRGPGATMWGANAVNGVINIITRKSTDSQGSFMATGIDDNGRAAGELRYGGRSKNGGYYRFYAKSLNRSPSADPYNLNSSDSWDQTRAGFRYDLNKENGRAFTVQGDVYSGGGGQLFRTNYLISPYSNARIDNYYTVSGGNVLARWEHPEGETADSSVQFYFDRTTRSDIQIIEKRNTFNLDFQRRIGKSTLREATWGLGCRITSDDTGTGYAKFTPDSRTDKLFSAFVQNELTIRPDRFRLTFGSKFEHNDYTGFEIQPSIRMLYTPDAMHAIWAAVSRAVRTPSRGESDGSVDLKVLPPGGGLPLPTLIVFNGNPDLKSEKLIACEAGYRMKQSERLTLDFSTFFSDYRDLRTGEPGTAFPVMGPTPYIIQPVMWDNKMKAMVYGLEASVNWQPHDHWRIAAGYTRQQIKRIMDASSRDTFSDYQGYTPRNQFNLRSFLDLPRDFELDTMVYMVGRVRNHYVPGYTRLDLRLGWHSSKNFSISLDGQNLLDSRHMEFGGTMSELPLEVQRCIIGRAEWRF